MRKSRKILVKRYESQRWIARSNQFLCSATHPSRTTKPKIRILGIVVREGCVALHYSFHFFLRIFSFAHRSWSRGRVPVQDLYGSHTVLCVCPTRSRKWGIRTQGHVYGSPTQPYKILYGWVGEPAVSIHMALSSNPSFSRAGRADTQTVWEPYRSCTDTLPLDYYRCAKEKIRKKKWTE